MSATAVVVAPADSSPSAKPAPDIADVPYGPHERQVLDFWRASSDGPAPLVVYIHGGGFRGGSKRSVSPELLRLCLSAGISVASVEYRLSPEVHFPAHYQDGARAIQFLRHRAREWNLDPGRVAATGGSAGAGISLWLGFHDDLADPQSSDPVLRESTRLTCMGVVGAQSSYDPRFIQKLIGGRAHEHPALQGFYGLDDDELDSERAYRLYHDASPINYVDAGDPPVFMYYLEPSGPLPPNAPPGQGIHHPNFGKALKAELDPLGIECELRHRDDYDDPNAFYADMVSFFQRRFREASSGDEAPELLNCRRIWNEAPHNAFTDLARFDDRWFCVFREADDHVGGDGRIRVLQSTNGSEWTSAAVIAERGVDLRDPKLSVTPDGRLMMLAGGSVYAGTKQLKGRQPRVALSSDGQQWTPPRPILTEGHWLWRVTWHDGRGYGVSYLADSSPNQPADDWRLRLYSTADGVHYEPVTSLKVPDRPNETTLRFLDDDTMIALVRREAGDQKGWIGKSRPPYREWTWAETDLRLGGPNFIVLPDGALWAATRVYPGGPRTALARMTPTSLTPALTLPSGGDTSYPGLVWHEDRLWMSYYSSHEGKSSIYLAQIRLP